MMVDVTSKTYYSLVAHQRIVGFSCYSYMKLQVCTVIYNCHYHQTIRVQLGQCRMPLLLQAKYLQCKHGSKHIPVRVSIEVFVEYSGSHFVVHKCFCDQISIFSHLFDLFHTKIDKRMPEKIV